MKEKFIKSILIIFSLGLFFASCEKENEINSYVDYEFLDGYWVNQESYALQFINFYSNEQGRFGLYSGSYTSYDIFNYRLLDNQLAIVFISDTDNRETLHDLIVRDSRTIEISDLTDIPENPNKIYLKQNINTLVLPDTVELGFHDIYYSFEDDIRLQIDSIVSDSRCPTGAECIWEGNAQVRFKLISQGNYRYLFNLNSNLYPTDTLIEEFRIEMINVSPYPKLDETIGQEEYRVELIIKKE